MASLRILGCDPGLGCTGWGVIEIAGSKLTHIANGAIVTHATDTLGNRLAALHVALAEVIATHRPDAVAVEQAFVHKDPSAALKLGHARAIALLAAAEAGIEIAEYTPNHVKKSVVGVGHASKDQIQAMVRRLLPAVQLKGEDSADALAVAIAHAHLSRTNTRIAAAMVAQ
jgi:crossover junction endodeoxyribonuclease RuvC